MTLLNHLARNVLLAPFKPSIFGEVSKESNSACVEFKFQIITSGGEFSQFFDIGGEVGE